MCVDLVGDISNVSDTLDKTVFHFFGVTTEVVLDDREGNRILLDTEDGVVESDLNKVYLLLRLLSTVVERLTAGV